MSHLSLLEQVQQRISREQTAPGHVAQPRAIEMSSSPWPADVFAVRIFLPGIGLLWLVPDAARARHLGLRQGEWTTPREVNWLAKLPAEERLEFVRWCLATACSNAASTSALHAEAWDLQPVAVRTCLEPYLCLFPQAMADVIRRTEEES